MENTTNVEQVSDIVTENVKQLSELEKFLRSQGLVLLDFLIKVAICAAIYFIISKILHKLLTVINTHLAKLGVSLTARHFVEGFTKVLVLGFTLVTMIVQLNIIEQSTIAALIASAGVGISLAAQGTLSNFAGGVLLLILKPFSEGDYISVKGADVEGTVIKVELYYTTIYTPTREFVLVPNSELTNKSVLNSQLTNGEKRLTIKVGISYDADLKKALQILDRLMDEEERIRPENRRVFVDEMADSSVVVGLRCLVHVKDYLDVNWDMQEKIKHAFDEEGIEIPFNQLDVHIKDGVVQGLQTLT